MNGAPTSWSLTPRALGTVRVRLFVLLVIVTLPLATLSGLTILRSVKLETRLTTEAVRTARAVAVAALALDPVGGPQRVLPATALVWRIDGGAAPQPLTMASRLDALPADLGAALASGRDGARQRAIDGSEMQYANAQLADGTSLLLAVTADAALPDPGMLLGRKLAEVAAVLLVGFAAVAYGGDRLVAAPIRALGRGVERWRAGGRLPPAPVGLGGGDVGALWTSFEQATAAITKREAELRAATTQQELLMQEIHHRVKNNLQIVASLLNLQASRIRVPEARAEFQAARDRIRALATLHRHLYAYGELHTINMRGFLVELCEQLLAALGETPAGGRISLRIEAAELRISSDQAVPIALIVTECVSNAAKYAFPAGRSGHIAVRMVVEAGSGRDVGHLRIEDDGVGIAAGRAETEAGTRDGIGLNLIRGFARQLGATVEITHDHGTRYDIAIPLARARDPDVPSAPPLSLAVDIAAAIGADTLAA